MTTFWFRQSFRRNLAFSVFSVFAITPSVFDIFTPNLFHCVQLIILYIFCIYTFVVAPNVSSEFRKIRIRQFFFLIKVRTVLTIEAIFYYYSFKDCEDLRSRTDMRFSPKCQVLDLVSLNFVIFLCCAPLPSNGVVCDFPMLFQWDAFISITQQLIDAESSNFTYFLESRSYRWQSQIFQGQGQRSRSRSNSPSFLIFAITPPFLNIFWPNFHYWIGIILCCNFYIDTFFIISITFPVGGVENFQGSKFCVFSQFPRF